MSLFSVLQALDVTSFIPPEARSPAGAQVGLLYRAGQWENAHVVAQDLETPEGSYWHGILHRQEQDWSNARYWFRRAGTHPIYDSIRKDANNILLKNASGIDMGFTWDPIRMVRWCEMAAEHRGEIDEHSLTEIQVAEWKRLFEWCIG